MVLELEASDPISPDLTPILADISSDTWNIDPEKLEAAITPKTKAIIPVHYGGHPCEMDRILDLATSRNLAVVEDAAHSLGAFYKGVPIGKFGDTTCFSFYAIKNLTTGEGGMIVTNRDDLDEQFRILYTHGMSKDAIARYTSEGSWYYQIMAPGYKYNMTDLQAALGIHQLKKLDDFNKARTKIAVPLSDWPPFCSASTSSPMARASSSSSHTAVMVTLAPSWPSVKRVLPSRPLFSEMSPEAAARMWPVER